VNSIPKFFFLCFLVLNAVFFAETSIQTCPRNEFSALDGLKALKEEARFIPRLKKLFSGKWGGAADFYLQSGIYKIPTALSADLAKINIRVNPNDTERQILARFNPEYCLEQKPETADSDPKELPLNPAQKGPFSRPPAQQQPNSPDQAVPTPSPSGNPALPGKISNLGNLDQLLSGTGQGVSPGSLPPIG